MDGENVVATIVVKGELDNTNGFDSRDGAHIVNIGNDLTEVSDEYLIAADINNDGVISPDDSYLSNLIFSGIKEIAKDSQNASLNSVPTVNWKEINNWYTQEKIIELLNEEGYGIVEGDWAYEINIASSTTYSELEQDIIDILNINVSIDIEDKTVVILNDEFITLNIHWKIDNNTFSRCTYIDFVSIVK